jgi:hypothetical protein
MGRLVYGASTRADVDDRALAHLQLVILAKLRRQEGFAFSWRTPVSEGGGRRTVWIHPGVPIEFQFVDDALPAIDAAWADALMRTANTAAGLHLVPEPDAP